MTTPGDFWQPFGSPGCETCGTTVTAVVSGLHGRRRLTRAPTGPGPYHRPTAMAMVDAGNPHAAFAWLRAHLMTQAKRNR